MRFEKLLLAAAALCLVCMAPACSDDDPATDPEQNETPGTPGEGEGDGDDDSGEPGEPDTPDTPALTEGVRARRILQGRLSRRRDGQLLDQLHRRRRERSRRLLYPLPRFQRFAGGRPRFRGAGRQRLSDECRGVAIRPERSTATATPIWRATTTRAISPIPRRRAVRPRSR